MMLKKLECWLYCLKDINYMNFGRAYAPVCEFHGSLAPPPKEASIWAAPFVQLYVWGMKGETKRKVFRLQASENCV